MTDLDSWIISLVWLVVLMQCPVNIKGVDSSTSQKYDSTRVSRTFIKCVIISWGATKADSIKYEYCHYTCYKWFSASDNLETKGKEYQVTYLIPIVFWYSLFVCLNLDYLTLVLLKWWLIVLTDYWTLRSFLWNKMRVAPYQGIG